MYIYRCIKNRKGFTLVELLIVIIIIGVLAGMMMLSSGAATDKAERTAAEVAVRTVKSAINLSIAGVNTNGVTILYNYVNETSATGPGAQKILDSINEYLQGSDTSKISMYIYGDDSSFGYFLYYYPTGVFMQKPYYYYRSTEPNSGVRRQD